MSTPDRACPDYPNECVHPWAHARTHAEIRAAEEPKESVVSNPDTWYTITVVQHAGHPEQADDSTSTTVINSTVRPGMAATVLRGLADDIAPKKPVTRQS